METYPKYKDSGVPWLGKVPEHWEAIKTKHLFSERVQKGCPNEPLLAATQTKGVVPKSMYENRTVEAQKDLHLLKLVEPGDFVISLRSFQGGIEYAYYRGIISPAYTVMVPNKRILPAYYRHLAKSKKFISLLQTCVTGIREGQNINYEILRKTPLPVPTHDEQHQISHYLDWQTSKINKFIKAKKKLISLLKEQKQNIINEAVTKGINPNVKMKDSGVEWLGEVPEHWGVAALKHFCRIQNGITLGTNYKSINLVSRPYLRVANVQNGYFALDNVKNIELPENDVWRYELQAGDVLITEGGDLDKLGRGFVWEGQISGCLHQNHIFAVRVKYSKLLPEFLSAVLNAKPGREYFILKSKKTTNLASTNSSTVKAFLMPYISVEEQLTILEYIHNETVLINKTISQAEKEIELIQEYRTRLISDVVTGKIDVRSIKIPDFEHVEADVEAQEEESEDESVAEEIEE